MGPQDGVDTILDVMHELVHVRGRDDVEATLLGFGDCLRGPAAAQRTTLGLDDVVTFTGRADRSMIAEHLSAADVGLCPDLKTPLNDLSTMNKTMEYMAYALPSVSFDLVETRVSGGDSCLYVAVRRRRAAFADAVERLLDDPELRFEMAAPGPRPGVPASWTGTRSRSPYVRVFDRLLGRSQATLAVAGETDGDGHVYVDLDRDDEFRRFVLSRGPLAEHALGA